MSAGVYAVDKMREVLTAYLEKNALRKTIERYTILECICRIQGHFEVETLRRHVTENHFRVSQAAVYNTVELLMDAGLVVRHQFSSRIVQYELKSAALTHHHVICSCCGSIREVKTEKVKIATNYKIPKFTSEYHSLYIYGKCSKCTFREKFQKKKNNE
ncbi:MAG: transcriptional repressor [Tannerella sp.]|jgi:Fur family ferric uptake transcriptional regulator|nr:transcriptional repressor [Tannerella sp.]